MRNNCHKGIPEGGHEVMTHLSDWLPHVPEGTGGRCCKSVQRLCVCFMDTWLVNRTIILVPKETKQNGVKETFRQILELCGSFSQQVQ